MFCIAAVVLPGVSHAQAYKIETVVSGLEYPWALTFLPGGHLLVTERPGRLRFIERAADGRHTLRAEPVAGVPPVLAHGRAGLFDLMLDPDFARNGVLYLAFAHGEPAANHLRVVRARFDGRRLHDVSVIAYFSPWWTAFQG